MPETFIPLALCAGVLLKLIWRERCHDRERAEWTRERHVLLERIAGVRLQTEYEPAVIRAYGTEEDEWRVEMLRQEGSER
jgi:hypothetical protein